MNDIIIDPEKFDTPVVKLDVPDDTYKFQPLPEPAGEYPYHLDISAISDNPVDISMSFHIVGDTGSVRNPSFQKRVVAQMKKQFTTTSAVDQPALLYHLGDVVYNYGEAGQYASQFFSSYESYPAPIVAIAGNHDSDINPESVTPYDSLEAFTAVFCDTQPREILFSGKSLRKSMVQPNVYWTLKSPLSTIIGLHSNVPKFGAIGSTQRKWFIEELMAADLERPGKALIVCLHHAPYSADINHGSSLAMIEFLEGVFNETGIKPDIIFSGHVHNYQRFEKLYEDGTVLPFVVCGCGGYDELHAIADTSDTLFSNKYSCFEGVRLKSYCEDKHGFMKINIRKKSQGLVLTGIYYSLAQENVTDINDTLVITDEFEIAIP